MSNFMRENKLLDLISVMVYNLEDSMSEESAKEYIDIWEEISDRFIYYRTKYDCLQNEIILLRDTDKYYKNKIEQKIEEIINAPFSTEEERDCQAYAIDVLDELLNKKG